MMQFYVQKRVDLNNSLCIFLPKSIFLSHAKPTGLLNRIVGKVLYGVITWRY